MSEKSVERILKLEKQLQQTKHRLDAAKARAKTANQREETRRKIILGGLLIDAAQKDSRWAQMLDELMRRISRAQDLKAFEDWSLDGAAET